MSTSTEFTQARLMNNTADAFEPSQIDWAAPDFAQLYCLAADALDPPIDYQLMHLTEIGEGKPEAYRQAMANVISCLNDQACSIIYIIAGGPAGVELYLGIAARQGVAAARAMLQATFEGNFLGAKLEELRSGNPKLNNLLASSKHLGLITGVPSFNDEQNAPQEEDFQGLERLANSLIGEQSWQLIIVAEPGSDAEIRQTLEQIYELSTQLSASIKQSVQHSENAGRQSTRTTSTSETQTSGTSISDSRGKDASWSSSTNTSRNSSEGSSKGKSGGTNESRTTGTNDSLARGSSDSFAEGTSSGESIALTRERVDKRAEELQKHLSETLIERFLQGRSKGMYRTAIYVSAAKKATYERLSRGVVSIFQGNRSSVTPLRIHTLPVNAPLALDDLLRIRRFSAASHRPGTLLAHSVPFDTPGTLHGATWLNTRELALIAGMPHRELPGIKVRKNVDFALNAGNLEPHEDHLKLGRIIQHGRLLEDKTVCLPRRELTKHVFITGVTGAGKTTTCMSLLFASHLPFLVIEPAKTEYRALHGQGRDIDYYTLGREDLTPFRLNPFELVSNRQNLSSHVAILKATLAAVFPMEAAMPSIVEEAIINAYKAKGWDIHSTSNFLIDDPWAPGAPAWPTFSDMIAELDGVITAKGMGKEFEEKYRGSLVARLTSLTIGTKGRMLNTRYSLDFDRLLDRCVVIEMEELKDEQDKALFMGLILTRLAECMKQRHRYNPNFQHLTLVEEAHRLLSRTEPGDTESKKLGVEMFANLLAEIRKYGEGLIIADQIPNKLVPDVIKNTNTKIIHRLFAADDRNAIGDAIGLSDEQKDFLPLLQPGETIIYCGGWHAAVRVSIDQTTRTDNAEIPEAEIRSRGRQQLWEQRQRLLPNLSRSPALQHAEDLADFLHDGQLMLSMFLKINHLRGQPHATMREKIRQRLAMHLYNWQARLHLTVPEVANLLVETLVDCANLPFKKEQNWQEDDWIMIRATFPILLEKLLDSLAAFENCANSSSEIRQALTPISPFDSL